MRNFASHAGNFTSLTISSEIDKSNDPDDIAKRFDPEYYLQPEAKPEPSTNETDYSSDDPKAADSVIEEEQTCLIKDESGLII